MKNSKVKSTSSAYEFLFAHLESESKTYFGVSDKKEIEKTAKAWMNDKTNSSHRYQIIESYFPQSHHILDMASGCGTFVFYGLLNNYNVYGVEPELWKHEFIQRKAQEYNYPQSWLDQVTVDIGEQLPFPDNHFDCVSSYQTLEHVQDPFLCLCEMIRVTKTGGGIHIQCPDYRSAIEGHYLLPWLPLFPRSIARIYLKLLKRPVKGLETIQYTTAPRLKKLLAKAEIKLAKKIKVIDLNEIYYQDILERWKLGKVKKLAFLLQFLSRIKNIHRGFAVNLIIYVVN